MKIIQQKILQTCYNMAIGSLPPDEFVELERILLMLCKTRHLKAIIRTSPKRPYKCDECHEEIAPGEEFHYNIGTYCDPCAGAMQ